MAVEYVVDSFSPKELLDDFAEANRFTEEDLLTNRLNKISNSQMLRLAVQAMKPFYSAVITMAGWLIFVEVLRMFLPRFLQAMLFGKAAGGLIMLLGCVWAVIVGFLQSSKLTVLLAVDIKNGHTAAVEGRVASSATEEATQGLDKFHGEKKFSYRYVIKDLEVEVSEQGYELLHTKYDRMRPKVKIYYTPKSQMLLSIEPI
jgi:hypothetical protein